MVVKDLIEVMKWKETVGRWLWKSNLL